MINFVQGATRAPGGKIVLALRSTFGDGRKSNIVGRLAPRVPQTLRHQDIDFVVTEFGVASIRKLSAEARARGLVNIAHPSFRNELEESLHAQGAH